MKKSLYFEIANRGLDPNANWDRNAVLALENQKWYGIQGSTSSAYFGTSTSSPPANLPTGSLTMSFAVGARWDNMNQNSRNATLAGMALTVVSGWSIQDTYAAHTIRVFFGNAQFAVTHSMVPGYNYTFVVTLNNQTASLYSNGHYLTGANGVTYTVPRSNLSPFRIGFDPESNTLPAINWTLNFVSFAQTSSLSTAQIQEWDRTIRQYGPQPLPSASHFWYAKDLVVSGTHNHISSSTWVDRISGVAIPRISGSSQLILREYVPQIPSGAWR